MDPKAGFGGNYPTPEHRSNTARCCELLLAVSFRIKDTLLLGIQPLASLLELAPIQQPSLAGRDGVKDWSCHFQANLGQQTTNSKPSLAGSDRAENQSRRRHLTPLLFQLPSVLGVLLRILLRVLFWGSLWLNKNSPQTLTRLPIFNWLRPAPPLAGPLPPSFAPHAGLLR